MEFNKATRDMLPGDRVEGFYIITDAVIKTSSSGKPFLSAKLNDCLGSIDMKCWDYYNAPVTERDNGRIVKIRGDVKEFKGASQLNATHIRLATDDDEFDRDALIPAAPFDAADGLREVEDIVSSIEDPDYRAVCERMLKKHGKAFASIPAAKSIHHSFINGLLMHTLNMLRTANFLSDIYTDSVNRSLLLAGTLLHDFAKEAEFVVAETGLVTEYSVRGQLLGHPVMGAMEVADCARELNIPEDKSILLQHMILSHHGAPENGAAVNPVCAESELLGYIDLIDSRMEIYAEAFETLPRGTFSQRIFALDKKIYNHG